MEPKARKDAALSYAARGWRVIALHNPVTLYGTRQIACSCFRQGDCRTPGKHPRFDKWREVATTDPNKIRAWWQHIPQANVGIATGGLAGLVVIDIDGAEGRESLAKLAQEYGPLPETLRQSTGRVAGGTHHVFQVEVGYLDWLRNKTKIAPGIDIRTEGGLIVAAPSLHPSGTVYAWENEGTPIAPLPDWMGKLTRSQKSRQATFSTNGTRPDEALIEAVWPLTQRLKLARAALRHAEPAVEGENGSRACLKAAITVVRGYLVPTEGGIACDLLQDAYNPRCNPPWAEYELVHKINSASVGVDIPWGYRLSAIVDPEEWDLRPSAAQTPRQRLLAAMAPVTPEPDPDAPPAQAPVPAPDPAALAVLAPVKTVVPIAPTLNVELPARLARPALPKPAVELLWTPYPLSHRDLPPAANIVIDDDDQDDAQDECA
jgi:putative DNA primase/helicase